MPDDLLSVTIQNIIFFFLSSSKRREEAEISARNQESLRKAGLLHSQNKDSKKSSQPYVNDETASYNPSTISHF